MVAGGVLAGVPLHDPALFVPALGSAALYAGGIALNDAFDVEKDRALHPDRVLPRGLIGVGAAKAAGFVLLLLGILSGLPQGPAGVAAAAALAAAIVVYDTLPEGAGLLGAAVLGLCRGLNLFRGALGGHVSQSGIVAFAAIHFLLIFCITVVSLGEDSKDAGRMRKAAIAVLPFCYAGPAVAAFRHEESVLAIVVLVVCAELALWVVRPAHRSNANPDLIVPRGVFTLSLVAALYCVAMRAWPAAVLLLLLFATSRAAARVLAQKGS